MPMRGRFGVVLWVVIERWTYSYIEGDELLRIVLKDGVDILVGVGECMAEIFWGMSRILLKVFNSIIFSLLSWCSLTKKLGNFGWLGERAHQKTILGTMGNIESSNIHIITYEVGSGLYPHPSCCLPPLPLLLYKMPKIAIPVLLILPSRSPSHDCWGPSVNTQRALEFALSNGCVHWRGELITKCPRHNTLVDWNRGSTHNWQQKIIFPPLYNPIIGFD